MLLKLLKYDFRAMWKQLSLVWGAALVLAVVNRFTWFRNGPGMYLRKDSGIPGMLALAFTSVIIAMFVIAIGFVISRFSKGLLGDEGYLMHTLPVRSWQLVASKLICGTVTWIISGAVAFATPFIMTPWKDWMDNLNISVLFSLFRAVWGHLDQIAMLLEFCLMVLSAIIQGIAAIYLAVSIGHLFPRFRRLASVAAFIGLYILLINVYNQVFSAHMTQQLMDVTTSNVHGSLLTAAATMLIPAAVFLAAVCWILDHKLNLE